MHSLRLGDARRRSGANPLGTPAVHRHGTAQFVAEAGKLGRPFSGRFEQLAKRAAPRAVALQFPGLHHDVAYVRIGKRHRAVGVLIRFPA
jgi:hypothetical protein